MWFNRGATKGTTFIATTDRHSGHNLGLQNPETELWEEDEDGNKHAYKPSMLATQEWIWNHHGAHVTRALGIAKNSVVLLDLGDACHGNKYPAGLKTTRMSDQLELAAGTYEIFMPAQERIRAILLVEGTSAHNFNEGSAELLLLARLKVMFPAANVQLIRHGLLTVDGVTFEVAHHGPGGGSRKWLEGNIVRRYLQSLMMSELIAGETPAQMVLRAHHHVERHEVVSVFDGKGNKYTSEMILIPPLCGVTHYARQRAQSPGTLHIGMYAFQCQDGKIVDTHRFVETKDLRTRIVL